VRALGLAMQLSMKVQQHYTGLVARGDELFTGLRGEDEPGLATFDDDLPAGPAERVGRSAFDRVAETVIEVTEDDGASAADEALDELALEDLVDETAAPAEADSGQDADGLSEPAVLEQSPDAAADIAEAADTVEATVTDEGVPAVEPSAAATGPEGTTAPEGATAAEEATASENGAAPAAAPAVPVTAPIEGYDDWSIAQLRGRLRGYQAVTVADLVAYEEANRAREPYLRMLRNRLAKLDEQAVEASPLAPRG
jgi:hypothetical protein